MKEKENLNDSNNLDKGLDLMEALNENLDWLRSNGSYWSRVNEESYW